MKPLLLTAVFVLFLTGCAGIEPPSPKALLTPWSSTPSTRLGDSKEKILSKWGEPDEINNIGVDELGNAKEEWVYRGRYPTAPVDYKYLSKTKYLYFEGNNLVGEETKSIQQPQEENN